MSRATCSLVSCRECLASEVGVRWKPKSPVRWPPYSKLSKRNRYSPERNPHGRPKVTEGQLIQHIEMFLGANVSCITIGFLGKFDIAIRSYYAPGQTWCPIKLILLSAMTFVLSISRVLCLMGYVCLINRKLFRSQNESQDEKTRMIPKYFELETID